MVNNDFEKLKKDSKYEVIKLEDEVKGSDKKKEIVDNLAKELDRMFQNTKKFINDTKDSEKAKEAFENVKAESESLFEKTKKALKDFKEDDRVRDVIDNINEKLDTIAAKIGENETVKNVGNKVNEFVQSDKVQDGLNSAKKVTLDLADRAHDGLKNILKNKDNKTKDNEE